MKDRLNLAEALLETEDASRRARIALHEPTRSWSFEELGDTVARFAGALVGLGVKRGDRVAVLMPDGLEACAALLGTLWMGAIAVPLSELNRANDVRALVRDAGARTVVVHASLEPVLDEVRGELEGLIDVIVVGNERGREHSFDQLVSGTRPVAPAETERDDIAFLLYSTGPSENPRGVPHTHETPLLAYESYARGVLDMKKEDRIFSLARISTAYGLGAGLIFPLAAGAESILLPQQARSRAVFDVLAGMKPTLLFATPSLYSQLLVDLQDAGAASSKALGASLRSCVSGAETLPARLIQRMQTQLGVEVLGGYGLTEAFSFVLATPPGKVRPGSAGLLVPGYDLRVVDEEGLPCAPMEMGTLEINGPTISSGYWQRADESQIFFRGGGWLRTADRFMVDADGYYFHCGRKDDQFKVSGKWVSPGEVERTLLAHEAVWECAVVGVEDDEGLTKPLAYVVPNVGHEPNPELERELIEYVKREIAPYKYPRWVEFVDALPKGPHGKVLRYKLPRRGPKRRVATVPPIAR